MNYRILHFFHGRVAAILAGGLTKEAEVPETEIKRVIERKKKFSANPPAHTYSKETQ